MPRRLALLVLSTVVLVAAAVAPTASASPRMLKGIYDDANLLYGNPDENYRTLEQLRTGIVRINLHWGGRWGVAGPTRTVRPWDPNDGQYDWSLYDRAVLYATQHRVRVMFSIVSTPSWANGGRAPNVPPTDMTDLRTFAAAAAQRYSGFFKRPEDGVVLPGVHHWIAWNEPNNPVFLTPQYRGNRMVGAEAYAQICNAVVQGIKAQGYRGKQIACGVTAPRGNNSPRSGRPSVSPVAFLRAMHKAGARGFDAYAHHPYYNKASETPTTKPRGNAITLANIDVLIKEVTRLYGRKPIWITEYGYQTSPPRDPWGFAVTFKQQADYMRQAFQIAKKHPRIDMFVWFLLRDEPRLGGWQSGLMTTQGRQKPSYGVFRALR
ncbi:MAG TPA: DUF5722 domain-containing protein [Gaiellaceae bacterium]|nr:DUF5722 domain-containing protein [Gaiellaceae bacterium]